MLSLEITNCCVCQMHYNREFSYVTCLIRKKACCGSCKIQVGILSDVPKGRQLLFNFHQSKLIKSKFICAPTFSK